MHNKWPPTIRKQYETTMDDLVCTFMQITNCRLWLRGGFNNKGLDSVSMKLKVVAKCGDPKILVDAIKSY